MSVTAKHDGFLRFDGADPTEPEFRASFTASVTEYARNTVVYTGAVTDQEIKLSNAAGGLFKTATKAIALALKVDRAISLRFNSVSGTQIAATSGVIFYGDVTSLFITTTGDTVVTLLAAG